MDDLDSQPSVEKDKPNQTKFRNEGMDFGTIQGFQETQNLESVRKDRSGAGTPAGSSL